MAVLRELYGIMGIEPQTAMCVADIVTTVLLFQPHVMAVLKWKSGDAGTLYDLGPAQLASASNLQVHVIANEYADLRITCFCKNNIDTW